MFLDLKSSILELKMIGYSIQIKLKRIHKQSNRIKILCLNINSILASSFLRFNTALKISLISTHIKKPCSLNTLTLTLTLQKIIQMA